MEKLVYIHKASHNRYNHTQQNFIRNIFNLIFFSGFFELLFPIIVISSFLFFQKNIKTSEISENGSEIDNSLTLNSYLNEEFDDFVSFAVSIFPIVVVLSMIFSVKVLMTVRSLRLFFKFWGYVQDFEVMFKILRLFPKYLRLFPKYLRL